MLDLRRLAQKFGLDVIDSGHHHCHQGWLQTHCPNCTGGRHGYHLGFSLERGNFNCWRCGPIQKLFVIERLCRVTRAEARKLAKQYDNGRRRVGKKKHKIRKKGAKSPPELGKLGKAHKDYLRSRGFPRDCESVWDLHGTRHLSDVWNWRVVAPIKNMEQTIVGYLGRSIDPDVRPKVRVSDDEDCVEEPEGFLYGIHRADDKVLVVEGLTDVWSMGEGAVATLGIDWSPKQAMKIKDFSERFIMFDPERKAQKKAHELAEWLGSFPGSTEIIDGLPCDPGDLPRKERKALRKDLGL